MYQFWMKQGFSMHEIDEWEMEWYFEVMLHKTDEQETQPKAKQGFIDQILF